MDTGVKTNELDPATLVDSILANRNGSTVQIELIPFLALLAARLGPSYATRAELYADLDWPDGAPGYVQGDATPAYNGVYKKAGVFGTGSWGRIGDLPSGAIEAAQLAALHTEVDDLTANKADQTAVAALTALIDDEAAARAVAVAAEATDRGVAVAALTARIDDEADACTTAVAAEAAARADGLALLADVAARFVAARPSERVGRWTAPGLHPTRYRRAMSAGAGGWDAASVVQTPRGRAIQIVGAGMVVAGDLTPIGPSDTDEIRFGVRRHVAVDDPAGDAVRFGVACYDAAGQLLPGGGVFARLGEDLPGLNAAGAEHWRSGRIALSPGVGIDLLLPAGTCYYAPVIRAYGANPGLAVIQCESSRGGGGTSAPGLHADAVGALEERDLYDAESAGFVFLAADGDTWGYYVRIGTSGWAGPSTFRGAAGEDGLSSAVQFSARGEAATWLASGSLPDYQSFWVGEDQYLTLGAATMIPDMPGAIPVGRVTLDHFGAVGDNVVNDATAIKAARDSGIKRIWRKSGKVYLFDEAIDMGAVEDFAWEAEADGAFRQGANANPGFFWLGSKRSGLRGGRWIGNYSSAGPYNSLFTTTGITSGESIGTANGVALTGASTIAILGLGTGWLCIGDRITVVDTSGATNVYWSYINTVAAEIVSGQVAATLNRGLDMDLITGQTVYVSQYGRRMCLPVAAPDGATTITLRAPDIQTGAGEDEVDGLPRIMAGDQFCFHTDNNNIREVDYATVYTATADAEFTGSYPARDVTITFTPPLSGDKVKGQMITSIQDMRNNLYTANLGVGTEDCFVEGVVFSDLRLHGAMFNASVRSPYRGMAMEAQPNIRPRISGCRDLSAAPGVGFGGVHCADISLSDLHMQNAPRRNLVQCEQSGTVFGSRLNGENLKTGVMISGECEDVVIHQSEMTNCAINYDLRTICRRMTVTTCIGKAGVDTLYNIRGQAGTPADDDPTFNMFATIFGNKFSGRGKVSDSYGGCHIMIQSTDADPNVNAHRRPHFFRIFGNDLFQPGRHGVLILAGVHGEVFANTVYKPGLSGIKAILGDDVRFWANTVVDAGREEPSPAYDFEGGSIDFVGNHADLLIAPFSTNPQTYGVRFSATTVVRLFSANHLRGSLGRIDGLAAVNSTIEGAEAGASRSGSDLRNAIFGARAMFAATSAFRNVAIGYGAGDALVSGGRNTLIGYDADVSVGTINNGIALGHAATVTKNNEFALGSVSAAILTAASATAGGATALPATPAGYLNINLNGVERKFPFFAV